MDVGGGISSNESKRVRRQHHQPSPTEAEPHHASVMKPEISQTPQKAKSREKKAGIMEISKEGGETYTTRKTERKQAEENDNSANKDKHTKDTRRKAQQQEHKRLRLTTAAAPTEKQSTGRKQQEHKGAKPVTATERHTPEKTT